MTTPEIAEEIRQAQIYMQCLEQKMLDLDAKLEQLHMELLAMQESPNVDM